MWFYLLLIAYIVYVFVCLYNYILEPKRLLEKRGLEVGSRVPIFGESWRILCGKESWGMMIRRTYQERGVGKRYYGVYNMGQAIIALKDPELIKKITVKDFKHFTDHMQFIIGDVDPLWSKNLFSLTGKKWRNMRKTLLPVFTTNKMKRMFKMIHIDSQKFVKFFEKQNQDVVEVELKDAFTRFTNDVIAVTIFGVLVESLERRNNSFYLMGKKATSFGTPMSLLKLMVQGYMPRIAKFFGWGMYTNEVRDFFRETIKEIIEVCERDKIVRHDMINLLREKRNIDGALSDDDITAQALIFLLGGFESVANVICFTAYELAVNPDIQDRLRQEILDTIEDSNGELTYQEVTKMKYLDMVISESLRMWPNNVHMDRVGTRPYTIEATSPDEKSITLKKGDCIWVPVYGLHMDPTYFPDPEKFDPERFSDENKPNIIPYTYLPFGVGRRKCIGSRFALLEAKIFLCELLRKFQIVPTEKSQIPLKLKLGVLKMTSAGGFNFGFKKIERF